MAATTISAVMPASRNSQQTSSLKRSAVNRSRSRQGVLSRSLEDLHASLLKAGARRGRLSTLKVAPTTRENEQPTPPVTASSSGSSDCHHDFDLPVKCRQSTTKRDDGAETPVCKVLLPGKHAATPPSPTTKPPPVGATTAVADRIGSADVDAEWVWSQDLKSCQKEQKSGKQAGGYERQRCKAAAVVAVATENRGGDASKISKLLLVDDLPWTFGSVCSTEAPTERTLSLGDDSSASVTTQVTSNSVQKGHRRSKLQVQGSALDAPFLTRLSDMSLRFPDPPTRPPPPATAATSSRTVTISGWGKSMTAGMPSLQLLLPSTWRKGIAGSRRRRNTTARWVARSKATNSMAESSSFQSRRIFRSNQSLRRPKEAPRPDPDAHEYSDSGGDEAGYLPLSSEKLTLPAADEPPLPPPPEGVAPSPPRPTGDDKEGRSSVGTTDGEAAPYQQHPAFSAGIQSKNPSGNDGAAALSAACAPPPAPAPALNPDPAVDSLTTWVWRGVPSPRQKAGNRRRLTVAGDYGQGAAEMRRETPARRFVIPPTPRAPARAPRKKFLAQ